MPQVIAKGVLLTEAGLAFLGLGGTGSWSWGNMLFWATEDTAWSQGAWWWYLPPGLCIALVGTSLALINFGIDEVLNPRLRSARLAGVPLLPRQPHGQQVQLAGHQRGAVNDSHRGSGS